MKTRKIITNILIFSFIVGCVYYIRWVSHMYTIDQDFAEKANFVFFIMFVLFCLALMAFVVAFFVGEFDGWLSRNVDPIIDKVSGFFNRRNKL